MFLHLSVSHSVHRGLGDVWPTPPELTPPIGRHPQAETPQADIPRTVLVFLNY